MSVMTGNDSDAEPAHSQWTPDRIAQLRCVVRDDGKKSHIFLDHSNKCQCEDVDLHAYRKVELR